ncbi:MAG TPA: hypothetical protein PK631_00545 [Erysipelotrichaceae bacterium]|nr:hypothetical protein [Erysipelotrichaceae bacterium]
MRKIISLFLVLIILSGLTGCLPAEPDSDPGTDPGNVDTGLTIQELWDYLDNYNCFITGRGVKDSVFIFDNTDDLMVKFPYRKNPDDNFHFTEIISFDYEGNNRYKIEYENPYVDALENAIFYIEFNPEHSNTVNFGTSGNGEIYYQQLYGDEPLTIAEILEIIDGQDYWLSDTGIVAEYKVQIIDGNTINHGIMFSGYGRSGTVSHIEFKGMTTYEITIDYPAKEPSEIDEGYAAYSKTHKLVISPYIQYIGFETDKADVPFKWFYPDTGLTITALFDKLEGKLFESGNTGIEYRFEVQNGKYCINVNDPNSTLSGLYEVSSLEYIGGGHYTYKAVISGGNNVYWMIDYNYHDGREMKIVIYSNGTETFSDKAKISYWN